MESWNSPAALSARIARRLLMALVGFVVVVAAAKLWPAPTMAGGAEIVDGDSLRIGGQDVRLEGIDAPELSQTCEAGGKALPCGREAKSALIRLIDGRPVDCRVTGRDRYKRALAVCSVGGEAINARLVREGFAVSFAGKYLAEEAQARAAGRGVWATRFERPSEWRAKHGRGS